MPPSENGSSLPRWARIVDATVIAMLVVMAIVKLFGGFRYEWIDIASDDLWGLGIRVLVLSAVRHILVFRNPLPVRLWSGLRSAWTAPSVRAALPVFVATRPTVLVIGLLSLSVFGYAAGAPPFRVAKSELSNLMARWDTGWYLGIARGGYRWNAKVTGSQNVAFFPLFPKLMRYTSALLGNQRPPTRSILRASPNVKALVGGVLISFAAFFGALIYLYRLAREDLDEEQARTALALIACYPFAVFFSVPYTESLFLLTTVAAFYHFRKGEALPAAGWGFAAGLTRPNGCFLSVPLALMLLGRVWSPLRRGTVSRGEEPASKSWWQLTALAAATAMPGLAMLAYSAFIYWLSGRPFAWVETQAGWGRSYGIPFVYEYRHIAEWGLYDYSMSQPLNMLNTLAALGALAMIWPVARRLGVAYAAFTVLNIVPTLMTGMLGVGRYTSVLFPNFLALGLLISASGRVAWLASFAVLQGLAAALFFTWRTMF